MSRSDAASAAASANTKLTLRYASHASPKWRSKRRSCPSGLAQIVEQPQPVLELACREVVAPHHAPADFAHLVGPGGVAQEIGRTGGRVLDGVDEIAVLAVVDLHRDAAAAPADH